MNKFFSRRWWQAMFVAMVFSTQFLTAQTGFWERADGGFGEGDVNHLAVNAAGHLFAGTNLGVYRSTNGGASWARLTDGIVSSIAIHPNGDIYVGECAGSDCGLQRSTDNGETWSAVNLGVSSLNIHALAIRVSGTIFASASYSPPLSRVIFRSTDNGTTWSSMTVTSGDTIVTALGLASGLLFAGLSDPSLPFGFGTIRRSTDDGATWSSFSPIWANDPVNAIVRNSAGFTIVATKSGIRRSTDFGATWTLAGFVDPVNAIAINSIGYLFATAGDLLSPTNISGGLFRSTNRGDSWVRMDTSVALSNVYSVGLDANGSVYAGTPRTGVFHSADTGATWNPVNRSLFTDGVHALTTIQGGALLAGTNDGVFGSTNSGGTWVQHNTGLPGLAVYALHEGANGYLFAGFNNTGAGIARSSDGGNSWTSNTSGLGGVRTFSIVSKTGGVVFAGTSNGIFRSTDNGTNWSPGGTGAPPGLVHTVVILPPSGDIIAGGSGAFLSSDNGSSWIVRSTGLGGTSVSGLYASTNGTLFAGTDAGVYRSTNEGALWIPASAGLPSGTIVNALQEGGDGFLYAATQDSGMYRSTDSGTFWSEVNSGISNPTMTSLAVSSTGYLFAGAVREFGTGITLFRTVQPVTSVTRKPLEVPAEFALQQNYPNPFNPATTIRYELPFASHVTLTVFNVLGQHVTTLADEEQPAGRFTVLWDGAGGSGMRVSSGIYFLQENAKPANGQRQFMSVKKMILLK